MGEEAHGSVKALCPSAGRGQDQEAGVGGLVSRARGLGIEGGCFFEGKTRNWDNI